MTDRKTTLGFFSSSWLGMIWVWLWIYLIKSAQNWLGFWEFQKSSLDKWKEKLKEGQKEGRTNRQLIYYNRLGPKNVVQDPQERR